MKIDHLGKTRLALFLFMICGVLGAEETCNAQTSEDSYDFSWLDPDKKIHVLQNRRYRKAIRPMIFAMGGVDASGVYRTTYVAGGRLSFYFTEMFGLEAFGRAGFHSQNNNFHGLVSAIGSNPLLPQVREIDGSFGGLFKWAPWYAKINVFNVLIYFDWYVSAGAGQLLSQVDTRKSPTEATKYVSQNLLGLYLGTGHIYHFSDRWMARLDVMGTFFQAPLYGTYGLQAWFSTLEIELGVGFKI